MTKPKIFRNFRRKQDRKNRLQNPRLRVKKQQKLKSRQKMKPC